MPLGPDAGSGTLVAGAKRADFPRETERLLLSVAANQAASAVRAAELAKADAALRAELARHRRAEDAPRDSEGTLRKIMNTLPVTAWSTLPDGYCDFVSERWLEYAGFSAAQAQGWGWGAVIHPDDAPRLVEYWQSCLASGAAVDVEARMRRADGAYRWFLFRANPLRDEAGKIVKWYGTNVDIQDRKLAQEELEQSERDARLIVDCIPAQVAVLGPTGVVTQINRRMSDFFGSIEALADWKTGDIVPADELPRVLAGMGKAFAAAEPFEMENHLRRFDGVYRWFQIRGLPLLDANGRVVRWYFLIADIEERKQAEEALRRSEAFLAEAQRISSTGSFAWSLATDRIIFSEELYRMFELDADVGLTLAQISTRVHPDDVPVLSKLTEQVRGSGSNLEYEMRLRMADGRIKYLQTSVRQSRDSEGRQEVIGVMQDISERRLAEEALSRVRSELAEMTRVASLGALTASIAHEVNQPLSGIVINANTCLRLLGAAPPDVEGALRTVRRILRDGNRAADVIVRLRALFAKNNIATEALDLNEATREVLSLALSDLQRNRVVLRSELADDLPHVNGDRIQLQQVILNLIRNASEAMVGVDDRPRLLEIRTQRGEDDSARLTVRDVGVGLQVEDIEQLFQAFYTTKQSGMGIGLSVSRSIVESHGGRMWAAPNPDGPGASLSFSIPLTAPR